MSILINVTRKNQSSKNPSLVLYSSFLHHNFLTGYDENNNSINIQVHLWHDLVYRPFSNNRDDGVSSYILIRSNNSVTIPLGVLLEMSHDGYKKEINLDKDLGLSLEMSYDVEGEMYMLLKNTSSDFVRVKHGQKLGEIDFKPVMSKKTFPKKDLNLYLN